MLSEKGIKRLTGFLFLFILATSALSGGLAVELNADPDQIANTLRNIAEDPGKYRTSITFDLVSHMAIIAIASTLYLTFNKYNRQLALFGTLWRVVEGVIMAFTELNNFVLLEVAQNFLLATGTRAVSLESLAQKYHSGVKLGSHDQVSISSFRPSSVQYTVRFEQSRTTTTKLARGRC